MIEVWGLKTCDTCRKALKSLPGAVLRDVRTQPLTEVERAELLARFGAALINRASTTWRGLDEAARALPPVTLLERHPALMKRPVIHANGAVHLGWGAEVRAALGVD